MIKSYLIVGPAALLPVEPERLGTYTELEVRHPRSANVDDTSHHSCTHAHKENAHPSRPSVVSALEQPETVHYKHSIAYLYVNIALGYRQTHRTTGYHLSRDYSRVITETNIFLQYKRRCLSYSIIYNYFNEVPDGILSLFHDVSMPHAISSDVPLPIDGVEVIVLPDAGDLVCVTCYAHY